MPTNMTSDDTIDDPGTPTKAECDQEEFDIRVTRRVRTALLANNEWYARADTIVRRFTYSRHGSLSAMVCDQIHDKMLQMEDADYEAAADALIDADALAADPYAYYGVSRSDFM